MDVAGATFVVSGGASGLGAGTVRMLAAAGARALIADLDATRGEALARELGDAVRYVRTDVTDEASAAAAVKAAVDAFGPLRGLVNCAGIVHGEKVIGKEGAHSLAGWRRAIDINLTGTFNMLRLAALEIAKAAPNEGGERGVIVNTASVAAYDGQIGQAAYSSSKGGVVGMTLPVARDLSRAGIRVMTIAPGIFRTPMLAGLPQEAQDSLGKQVPFPSRLGDPAEYGALACHIVENQMLNGEVIRLDGAIRMAPR
jgi:NAD(P)-dependent dehydrogenase (short-subunit alcohol dehydrogenase family)